MCPLKETLGKGLECRESERRDREERTEWVCPCAELLRQLGSMPLERLRGTCKHTSEMHHLNWEAETFTPWQVTHTNREVPSRVLTSDPPTHTCTWVHTHTHTHFGLHLGVTEWPSAHSRTLRRCNEKCSWLLTTWGLGVLTLPAVKNSHMTLQWALPSYSSASMDPTNQKTFWQNYSSTFTITTFVEHTYQPN